jgi:MFS superfamily sulfate permease-like transporter
MPDTKTLTPEEAYNVLVAQVHAPVFFNKLASVYNITPQSPAEARELLLLAGQLRNAHEQDATKQASARGNFYAEARNDLNNALTQNGFQIQPIAEEDGAVKRAAADAVQNPLIKEAAVVFSNHLAQALQAR